MHRLAAFALLSLIVALACRDKPASTATRKSGAGAAAKSDADKWADTGRVIDQGVASFSIISDTTCPGTRVVSTRFETPQDLVVRITHSGTLRDCVEGMRSEFVAVARARSGAFIDSIHGYGSSVGVVDVRDAIGDPLLVDNLYGGGSGAMDESEFWNLRTGKRVFHSEGSLHSFVANGKTRYLSTSGGRGDTVGIIEYGDARRDAQRLVFKSGHMADTQADFQVDSVALEGPMIDGHVAMGTKDDTVAVRGVTVHVRVTDPSSAGAFEFGATIVDDRLVALPVKRLDQP